MACLKASPHVGIGPESIVAFLPDPGIKGILLKPEGQAVATSVRAWIEC